METILATSREKHIKAIEECMYPAKIWLVLSSYWFEYSGTGWTLGIFFYLGIVAIPTMTLQMTLVVLNINDMTIVIGVIMTMLCVIMGILKTVFLLVEKKKYCEIYHDILYKFWPINWCSHGDEVFKKLNILKVYFWMVGISNLIIIEIWLFFPYADPLPGHRRKPILIFIPEAWHGEEFPVHQIVCAIVYINGFSIGTVVAGFDALFLFIIYNAGVQFQLLKKALHNMAQLPEEKIRAELKFIVDYHEYLTQVSRKICASYNNNNGLDLFTSLFLLSCFFCFFQTEEDPVKKIKLLMFLFVVVTHMVIYGLAGSWFLTQQEAVADAAYCSEWYNRHPNLRLSLIHMLQIANRPHPLTACSLTEVNAPLVITVFKTAFSVGTLFGG